MSTRISSKKVAISAREPTEVDTFERSLEGCIPENSLLSHDLLEGVHGRTALVTSTVLIEDMPPNYLVHSRRMHRWTRGDWQLLPWLFSRRLSSDQPLEDPG